MSASVVLASELEHQCERCKQAGIRDEDRVVFIDQHEIRCGTCRESTFICSDCYQLPGNVAFMVKKLMSLGYSLNGTVTTAKAMNHGGEETKATNYIPLESTLELKAEGANGCTCTFQWHYFVGKDVLPDEGKLYRRWQMPCYVPTIINDAATAISECITPCAQSVVEINEQNYFPAYGKMKQTRFVINSPRKAIMFDSWTMMKNLTCATPFRVRAKLTWQLPQEERMVYVVLPNRVLADKLITQGIDSLDCQTLSYLYFCLDAQTMMSFQTEYKANLDTCEAHLGYIVGLSCNAHAIEHDFLTRMPAQFNLDWLIEMRSKENELYEILRQWRPSRDSMIMNAFDGEQDAWTCLQSVKQTRGLALR